MLGWWLILARHHNYTLIKKEKYMFHLVFCLERGGYSVGEVAFFIYKLAHPDQYQLMWAEH